MTECAERTTRAREAARPGRDTCTDRALCRLVRLCQCLGVTRDRATPRNLSERREAGVTHPARPSVRNPDSAGHRPDTIPDRPRQSPRHDGPMAVARSV